MSQVGTPALPALPQGGTYIAPQLAGPSMVAMLPEYALRVAWRWRWQLAPVTAGVGVLTCGQSSPVLTVPLAAAAGCAYWAHRSGVTVAGRMFLSRRERWIASTWLGAASAWTLTAGALHPSPRIGFATATAALGWPTWQWAAARIPKRARMSPAAKALVASWASRVAIHGPMPVAGSHVVRGTVTEPGPGAVTFEVSLRLGVHGRDAATDTVRQAVERLLELPVDTVVFTVVRDDSGRIRVTLSPNRHLESGDVEWPGPLLNDDGTIPLGASPDGRCVSIALFNDEGVEHALLAGTSGAGKTGTVAAIALPGVSYGIEVLWFLDGGEGTSAPFLRAAADWYAMSPDEWPVVIDAAHAVLLDRKFRRGRGASTPDQERDAWHMWDEEDPILTLFLEEATTIGKKIPKRCHDRLVEILREGRKLGIRVVQVAQSPKFDQLVGGIDARNLMTGNGSVIALRPGGSNDARLTLDSTDVDLDLRALPPEPGFAAVVRRGKVLAPLMRVANAKPRAAQEAAKVTVRALAGRDELAAGANYLKRRDPEAFIPVQSTPSAAADAGAEEESPQQIAEADAVILAILRGSDEGLTLQEIGGDDAGNGRHPDWRWTRRTASTALMRLSGLELVSKHGARWVALEQPAENEETR